MTTHVTTFDHDNRLLLACPACGCTFTHLAGYRPYEANEVSRFSIELTFTCEECGGTFAVDFRQYKGETEVTVTATAFRLAPYGWNGVPQLTAARSGPAAGARAALAAQLGRTDP